MACRGGIKLRSCKIMEKLTIGQQLLRERKRLNLTQGEVYSRSKISVSTIGALEQGRKTEASTYVIRQLSAALNHYKFEL